MPMMHRFSPYSTGAIKGRNNGKKKKKMTREHKEKVLLQQLQQFGFSFERADACIPYLEKIDLHHALDFFNNIEPNLIR